ncbi:MAG TPA: RnfABCDGE type electron transport complex subunit G [Lentimicrobium sp.]|nr:RnfABCDGE type electron transport complex subunit G [Lentimicrobium sp.]
MAKAESSLKNMVLSLLGISLVMSAALGFVYNVTKEPIEKAAKEKEISAIKEVLPPFDNDIVPTAKDFNGIVFYTATKNGSEVGYAAKTFTEKGYSGRFDLMVGFLPDGTINNVVVLQQKETPGLGSNMVNPKFHDQFLKINIGSLKDGLLKVKKDGGTIDAISAATISSRAYCDGLQKAYDIFTQNFAQKVDTTMLKLTIDSTAVTKGGKK